MCVCWLYSTYIRMNASMSNTVYHNISYITGHHHLDNGVEWFKKRCWFHSFTSAQNLKKNWTWLQKRRDSIDSQCPGAFLSHLGCRTLGIAQALGANCKGFVTFSPSKKSLGEKQTLGKCSDFKDFGLISKELKSTRHDLQSSRPLKAMHLIKNGMIHPGHIVPGPPGDETAGSPCASA